MKRTAAYVSERKQFGIPLGSFQALAMRMADSYIDVEAIRSTYWLALWRLSEGLDARAEVRAAFDDAHAAEGKGWLLVRSGSSLASAANKMSSAGELKRSSIAPTLATSRSGGNILRIVWVKVRHIFLKLLEKLRNLVHLPSWPSWRRFRLYFARASPLWRR